MLSELIIRILKLSFKELKTGDRNTNKSFKNARFTIILRLYTLSLIFSLITEFYTKCIIILLKKLAELFLMRKLFLTSTSSLMKSRVSETSIGDKIAKMYGFVTLKVNRVCLGGEG